ncbi:MAG: hypothetical protein ACREE1_09415, partial [Stellaceae bacterium]
MELSSVARPPAEAEGALLFVVLELRKATGLVALHGPAADKVGQHLLAGGEVDGRLALIGRKREPAQMTLGRPGRAVSWYEAGDDGFWRHRLSGGRGIDNRVQNAASIPGDRRSRRARPDRLDAAGLLRTRRALDRGESRVCREVRVSGVTQADERRRSRERGRLVGERGQHASRIKGLLMTHGICDF